MGTVAGWKLAEQMNSLGAAKPALGQKELLSVFLEIIAIGGVPM